MKLDAGQVVMVQSPTGPALALVVYWTRMTQMKLGTREGAVVVLPGAEEECFASPRSILDSTPSCPACGSQRWWWTDTDGFGIEAITCATCTPPTKAWEDGLRRLADIYKQIPPDDPRFESIRSAVSLADEAAMLDDWLRFQQAAYALRVAVWLVLNGGGKQE